MPAKSKKQQRLMGMVHAYQKGDLEGASDTVKEIAGDIDPEDAEDFASTKHDDLPEKAAMDKQAYGGSTDEMMWERFENPKSPGSSWDLKSPEGRAYLAKAVSEAARFAKEIQGEGQSLMFSPYRYNLDPDTNEPLEYSAEEMSKLLESGKFNPEHAPYFYTEMYGPEYLKKAKEWEETGDYGSGWWGPYLKAMAEGETNKAANWADLDIALDVCKLKLMKNAALDEYYTDKYGRPMKRKKKKKEEEAPEAIEPAVVVEEEDFIKKLNRKEGNMKTKRYEPFDRPECRLGYLFGLVKRADEMGMGGGGMQQAGGMGMGGMEQMMGGGQQQVGQMGGMEGMMNQDPNQDPQQQAEMLQKQREEQEAETKNMGGTVLSAQKLIKKYGPEVMMSLLGLSGDNEQAGNYAAYAQQGMQQ